MHSQVKKTSTLLLLLLVMLISSVTPTRAQAAEDIEMHYGYRFAEFIALWAKLPANNPAAEVKAYFLVEGESISRSGIAYQTGPSAYRLEYDLYQHPIRAFSKIVYWFEARLANGEILTSPKKSFIYEDNRFDWQTLDDPLFQVHWYGRGGTYGQEILAVAQTGLKKIQTILPVQVQEPMDIYAYASAEEMRSALQIAGKSWVGAHTDPDLGVMTLSLPQGPEQKAEMERQIPHELMHILLYQYLGSTYSNLPMWLNEGLASIAERYPNPDYLIILESGYKKQTLIPIASLCDAFPRDASGAYMAYAESTSFTRYLQVQYGSSRIEELVDAYIDGMGCEQAIESTFGTTLSQLDRNWQKQAFNDQGLKSALIDLLPYIFLLLAIILAPLIIAFRQGRKHDNLLANPTSSQDK